MTLKSLRAAALPALLAGAAGCNTTICDRITASHSKLAAKGKPCGIDEGTFDQNVCLQGYKGCTDADVSTVNRIWDCLDRLPNCTAGTVNAWQGQVQDCQKVNKVAAKACSDALSVQGTP